MIYLDYNASTPTDERVVAAMLPYFTEIPGNAASVDHWAGHQAQSAVAAARESVASLLGRRPEDVVFTSGATEADNLAILGALAQAEPGAQLVASAIEHPAVLEPARQWGERLRLLRVDSSGIVDVEDLREALQDPTALVSVMAANNETGAIQPLDEVAQLCAEAGVPLHVDAAQAGARIPLRDVPWREAMISLSAHKMYGPKGVGALLLTRRRPRARLRPIEYGGGHERGLRPGTLNVPAIVGFGEAAALVGREGRMDWSREAEMRAALVRALEDAELSFEINGPSDPSLALPQTLNVRLPGVDAHALLRLVSGQLAVSTGSACTTTSVEPSHVLLAMGRSPEAVGESVRISFGRFNTEPELKDAADLLVEAAHRLRALSRVA